MTTPSPTVAVVIVTYGSRQHLLRQTLASLLDHHSAIRAIVVVDNGSEPAVDPSLYRTGPSPPMRLIRLDSNKGSAGGFGAGLHAARCLGTDFIWLLDDDNRPKPSALQRLLDTYSMLGSDPKNLVLSLRPDRYHYRAAVHAGITEQIVPNQFQGMSFGKFMRLATSRKARRSASTEVPRFPCVRLQFAPYGGLLLSAHWLNWIDGPDETFFVYADDFEYTMRIGRRGGHIYLCGTSEIEDIDISWYAASPGARSLMDLRSPRFRVYYSVRNHAVLEKELQTSWLLYWFNVVTSLTVLSVWGLAKSRSPASVAARLKLLVRAVVDGRRHRLGKVDFV